MRKSLFAALLLVVGMNMHAQPNIQQLEKNKDADRWQTAPIPTLILYPTGGGRTVTNAFGQIVETDEHGEMHKQECYIITDRYSSYAQNLGPQTYMLMDNPLLKPAILYSFKRNRLNPGCVKEINWETQPKGIVDLYNGKTPLNFYRRNAKGEKVLKKEKFPEVIQKLFTDNPDYYEKFSPFCKQMNLSDDVYVSLLIEALLKYNDKASLTQQWGSYDEIVFSAEGFRAKSGRSSFRFIEKTVLLADCLYPLEAVIPAGSEHDQLVLYPQERKYYSQNYLKQVQATKTIPQDYSRVQFDGEPCLLTDLYGFPAVFDNSRMYYLEQ